MTTANASSITIQGANGLDAGGMPKDSLNGKNEGTTLKISSSVPVTIKNLKITGGNAEKGGGIYNKKKLTLLSGCVVTGNTAEYGAGIYNDDGLILNGASIESNASTTYGGGIYNNASSAEVYVYGSTNIKNNTVTGMSYGGAVYNASSLYLGFNEKKEKTAWSGEFSGNTASQGIAIWSAGGASICFDSGTIKNNVSSAKWGILLMGTGSLEISGGARIDATDPVYFCPYGAENTFPTFKVSGELSGESPVATFIMKYGFWKRGQTILTAGDGVTLTKDITKKFSFTEEGWELVPASDGKSAYMNSPIYVAGSEGRKVCTKAGDDTSGTGSKSNPYATVEKACGELTNSTINYTIYIDGTVTGVQKIPSTISAASLKLQGNGTGAEIDASQNGPALTISAENIPITILKLKIKNGKTDSRGGGIHIPNTGTKLTLGDGTEDNIVVLIDNTGTEGGGIYNAGILTIKDHVWVRNNNETFTNSNADAAGGGIYNTGTLTMEGGQICKNESGVSGGTRGDGGGVFNEGTFYFKGGRIYNNIAWNRGGGIYNNGGTVFMSGTALLGSVEVNNVEITSAATGGINRSNLACSSGGGIYSAGESGVYVGYTDKDTADPDFTGGICFNYAKNDGGGIYGTSADVTIKIAEGSISYNGAGGNGGGIYNQKTLEITNGTFKGNSAAGGNGGGIYNISEMNLQGGTISGNSAASGGAVYNAGTFNMGGSAYIPYGVTNASGTVETGAGKNDVYLESDKTITITDSLTGTAPVATITPASYVFNISVLGGTSNLIAANYKKFAVVPQTVDDKSYEWFVSSTGILYTTEYLITSDSLASFSPNSSVSYTLTVDSTVGNNELESLISKMNENGVGAGTVLDLSESSATNLAKWIEAKVSSITIPKNCTNISSQEFQSAEWLTEINVPETNTSYCSVDGVLYSKDMKKLVHYPPSKADSTFTLPSTVTTLAYGAFEDNKYLETINGMTQITTLESMVTVSRTQKLKEIDLSGLTQSSLPYYTFEDSTSLEKVTLSSSITSIGLQCFQWSSALKEVHFKSATPPSFAEPEKKEDLDYYKNFKNCPNVIFYVPSSAVDSYKNATGENGFVNTDYNGAAGTTAGIQAKIVGE